jgi:hypothetical protein
MQKRFGTDIHHLLALFQYAAVSKVKHTLGLLLGGGRFAAPFGAFYQYRAFTCQFAGKQSVSYSWLVISHYSFSFFIMAAKIVIIIELQNKFSNFRSFVTILFGHL